MEEQREQKEQNEDMEDFFVPEHTQKQTVKEKDFVDVLKMFAPGTSMRSAMDDLLRAEMGALIVVDNGNISNVFQKGFGIHSRFTSQKLLELAKMDGAIIISKNIKKILYANAFLYPSQEIQTRETGTRHKAAERTARQTGAIVIAISERKNKITLYYGEMRYELKDSSEILRRAAETLQILEKQREDFNEALNNLNLLELQRMVAINDVCSVIQKFEIIKRISDVVKRYLVELGREGNIVSMRLKDLTRGLDREEEILLKDYFGTDYAFAEDVLDRMDLDFLLEPANIARILFEEIHDKKVSPRGLRILMKTNIPHRYIDSLIANFGTFDRILLAKKEELMKVFEEEEDVEFFRQEIYSLREKISVGKRI